jgi:hypothetical protein
VNIKDLIYLDPTLIFLLRPPFGLSIDERNNESLAPQCSNTPENQGAVDSFETRSRWILYTLSSGVFLWKRTRTKTKSPNKKKKGHRVIERVM